jgi:hypothetical protein
MDLRAQIEPNTVRVGDLTLSPIDSSSRQKIIKETSEQIHTLHQMLCIYRLFHATTIKYTFFAAVHGTFSKINHILEQKASLNKFKEIEILPCIISEQNRIKLERNNQRNHRKNLTTLSKNY